MQEGVTHAVSIVVNDELTEEDYGNPEFHVACAVKEIAKQAKSLADPNSL